MQNFEAKDKLTAKFHNIHTEENAHGKAKTPRTWTWRPNWGKLIIIIHNKKQHFKAANTEQKLLSNLQIRQLYC